MDQIKQEFLKKLTKYFIVVSIWVSSLLISHNFYLYRFTIQLITQALDKNYMFLICNGLLVFVVKYSGLITSSSKPTDESTSRSKTEKTFDYGDFESYDAILELEYDSVLETESFLAEEVNEESEDSNAENEETEEKQEKYDESLTNNGEQDEECGDLDDGFKEEEDDNNVGMITEEDMNKKFDEFIRKMKEELRIEAKRQLILV